MNYQEIVLEGVKAARDKADLKWGSGTIPSRMHTQADKYAVATILMEEVGEVARAILERDDEGLENELYDVAQVAVAWLEAFAENRHDEAEVEFRRANKIHTADNCVVHGSCMDCDMCKTLDECN